jgi:hypothetical protein
MTVQSFLDSFYILYDQVSDLASPGYTPQEISLIASKVQEDLILSCYGDESNRLKKGFEETEKRTEDLGELVRYKNYTAFTAGFLTNSVYVTLPNTLITNTSTDFSDVYWFTIYEGAVSNVLDCTIASNTTVYVNPEIIETSHIRIANSLKDPFSKPYIKGNNGKVLRTRSEGRKHNLITDGTFTITSYNLGYIRKPLPIDLVTSLTSEFSEVSDELQRQILDLTVSYCFKVAGNKEDFMLDAQIPKE